MLDLTKRFTGDKTRSGSDRYDNVDRCDLKATKRSFRPTLNASRAQFGLKSAKTLKNKKGRKLLRPFGLTWLRGRDLNPRLLGYEGTALKPINHSFAMNIPLRTSRTTPFSYFLSFSSCLIICSRASTRPLSASVS